MTFEKIRLEFTHQECVARITLACPKANILDRATIRELHELYPRLRRIRSTRSLSVPMVHISALALPRTIRGAALTESLVGTFAEPEDIGHAVTFLCGPGGGHITGQVLRVDGGQFLGPT